jgi:hypothetical protein
MDIRNMKNGHLHCGIFKEFFTFNLCQLRYPLQNDLTILQENVTWYQAGAAAAVISHHAEGLVDPNFDLQKNRNWF